MKTTTRSAMDRLAAARPPVADHTEGIVPRAERARLLHSIVEATDPASVAPAPLPVRRAPEPVTGQTAPARPTWADPAASIPGSLPGPRRRVLTAALVAAVVASGLGVAGLVGTGDDAAQVNAGPGEVSPPPPVGEATAAPARFLPGALPEGMVLQGVGVNPGGPPLAEPPHAEVYGRVGPDGTIDQAVAVLTARTPDFVEALVRDSGATTRAVPGEAGSLEIDFGQGLVARTFRTGELGTACGTGGCVEMADGGLTVMVLGRDVGGGADALSAIVDGLVLEADADPGDRVDAPTLVRDGFSLVYEGDQVPGLEPGAEARMFRYGDDLGQRSVTLRVSEGQDFDPAGLAWQYAETLPVKVRGHDGLLVANELGSSVTWQERPGLTLAVDVSGLTEDEAVDIANGVREVGEDEWRTVAGTSGLDVNDVPDVAVPSPGADGVSVTSDAGVPTGPETVLAEGEAGVQRWQLVGYPVDPTTGSGADVCTELRVDGAAVSLSCTVGSLSEEGFVLDSYVSSLGPEQELGDQVLFRGQAHPAVASVRFLLDTGESLDVPTVGADEGLGTHVVATMPADARSATVVLLDGAGAELQRLAFPSFRPVGG